MISAVALVAALFLQTQADSAAVASDAPQEKSEVIVEVEGIIQTDAESLIFDFQDKPLAEVVASIAPLTDLNFMYAPETLQGRVTVISHSPIPREKVLDFLAELLETHDLYMYEVAGGELIHIAPAGAHPAPIVVAPTPAENDQDKQNASDHNEK